MPKRTDIKTVLIIGAGPIVIGQACEFDYSGAQACKALREEGYRVVLVNSNPATIMTDPDMADAVYIEPINWQTVEKIIAKEKPDALLPTMGGQTALNCALDLADNGVLEKYGVELIGASREAIRMAEDRELFRVAMAEIGLECPKAEVATHARAGASRSRPRSATRPSSARASPSAAPAAASPTTARSSIEIVKRGLELSPTSEVLVEESVLGWKEFEMEVVRDTADNCIIVCSIENFDPMGVHTGDSITVAPAQTLTDKEYQRLRDASIAVLRKIGVDTGGSNVQFGINAAGRPRGRDRDEPARVALLGAGVEGDRLPDRQGRRQAGGRLHAGRAAQRDHRRRDAGLVRADASTTSSPRSRASPSRSSRPPTRA